MSRVDLVARTLAGLAFVALDIVALIALLRDDLIQAGAAVAAGLLCAAFAFRKIAPVNPY